MQERGQKTRQKHTGEFPSPPSLPATARALGPDCLSERLLNRPPEVLSISVILTLLLI